MALLVHVERVHLKKVFTTQLIIQPSFQALIAGVYCFVPVYQTWWKMYFHLKNGPNIWVLAGSMMDNMGCFSASSLDAPIL